MNFYKHHIGDYAQATAHLSFVEDAAYSRLIRKYYAEEVPLPADVKAVSRLVGARTKEEREAVQAVLEEFFSLEADGWHNKRCDAELQKANAQADTNRRIAEERESRRRERAALNEAATKRASAEHESCNESSAVREPSQTPDSRHQTPDTRLLKTSEADASAAGAALTASERVWAMGVSLLGEKGRPYVGKLLGTYGEASLLAVLADATRERPVEPKAWIVGACEARRVKQQPNGRAGAEPADLLADPKPEWALQAGFSDRFTAENAGCSRFNAKQFRNGQRVAA